MRNQKNIIAQKDKANRPLQYYKYNGYNKPVAVIKAQKKEKKQ